ncbi:Ms5788A family Cys-rich leader peptide [Mycolicibacterium austroafricanum]|uniref:Ms5788A family Cys-rich leader peptide n=1 Tax=Mycolicibacterium austroafricanum TaxID=39687 RepID=UPI003AF366BE
MPHLRRADRRRSALGAAATVGLITGSLGKLSAVSARLELLLTKRRAVDLCRVAGCCCCCCSC